MGPAAPGVDSALSQFRFDLQIVAQLRQFALSQTFRGAQGAGERRQKNAVGTMMVSDGTFSVSMPNF
jgi:hypothetical protein